MGITRKIASVATLGIINFRSKAEKLERSEFKADVAESRAEELGVEVEKKDSKLTRAEKKLEKAELQALGEAKKAKREKRRSSKSAESTVVGGADAAVVAGRRANRKAKKAAKKVAKKLADVTESTEV